MSYFKQGTPESQGVKSKGIIHFLKSIEKNGLELHRLMIIRHGVCIAKGTAAPYKEEQIHPVYSFSKSLTSTAIGFAWQEGLLSLDDRLVDIFPEYVPEQPVDYINEVTIEHLLTMSCGHETEINNRSDTCVKDFMNHPFLHKPGTFYLYNTAGTNVLSAIIKKKTGEDLLSYLKPRLFEPLGFGTMTCACLKDGTYHGGGGMKLTLEDMAKFTYFMLHKGEWNGKKLLNGWYEKMGTKQIETAGDSENHVEDWALGYGYQCWICRLPGSFRADGAFGQFGLVYPSLDMIVITNMATEMTQTFMDIVNKDLLPAVIEGDSPLEESTDARLLTHVLDVMKIAPLSGCRNPMMEEFLNHRNYIPGGEIPESHRSYISGGETSESGHWSGLDILIGGAGIFDFKYDSSIESMHFEFAKDRVFWTLVDSGIEKTIAASLEGNFLYSNTTSPDREYAASARWRSHNALEMEVRRTDAMSGVRLIFRIKDDILTLETDETLMTDGGLGMTNKILPDFWIS